MYIVVPTETTSGPDVETCAVSGQPHSTSLRRGDVWQLFPAAVETLVGRSVFDGARCGENAVDAVEHHAFHEVKPRRVGVGGRAGRVGLFGYDQMRTLVQAHQCFGAAHVAWVGDDWPTLA